MRGPLILVFVVALRSQSLLPGLQNSVSQLKTWVCMMGYFLVLSVLQQGPFRFPEEKLICQETRVKISTPDMRTSREILTLPLMTIRTDVASVPETFSDSKSFDLAAVSIDNKGLTHPLKYYVRVGTTLVNPTAITIMGVSH